MSTQALERKEVGAVSFTPFGSSDAIKLNIQIVQNLIAVPTKSGRTCSQRDALRFTAMCQAQRLNPFAGDAYLVGYDKRNQDGSYTPQFSLITSHQALLKRAEASLDYEGLESGIILLTDDDKIVEREGDFHLESEEVVGGWARVHRKGRKPTYKRLAISQRKPNYPTPFWEGNKASEQIVKCAEMDALRTTFPTLIGGLYTEGEIDVRAERFVSEAITDRRSGFSEGASALVETMPAEASQLVQKTEPMDEGEGTDLGPQRQKPAKAAEQQQQPQQQQQSQPASAKKELELLVLNEGFAFSHLQQFGAQSGNIDNADSLSGFEDVPEATAKRLLRAKVGLIQELKAVKLGSAGGAE